MTRTHQRFLDRLPRRHGDRNRRRPTRMTEDPRPFQRNIYPSPGRPVGWRAHEASPADHPGLTASVRVILHRGKEKYNRVLEDLPEVASRYRLVGLTRAPSCDPENEDWEDSDGELDAVLRL